MATDIVLDTSDLDFAATGLRVSSAIRLHRLMTVSTSVIKRELGTLSSDLQYKIAEKLCQLLSE
ncbi:type II toxin-antitoxin system PemK/MazF family toxin [Microcoleus sp. ZQ-A2]